MTALPHLTRRGDAFYWRRKTRRLSADSARIFCDALMLLCTADVRSITPMIGISIVWSGSRH